MLGIGKTFDKNGYTFCLLDLFRFNERNYALFSKEKDGVSYEFYEIIEHADNYSLTLVRDEHIKFSLLNLVERSL